jgi:predicted permease
VAQPVNQKRIRSHHALVAIAASVTLTGCALCHSYFTKYDTQPKRAAFHEEFLRRMGNESGIVTVALAATLPLSDGGTGGPTPFEIEGRPVAAQDLRPGADAQQVSDDYFRTIRVPLLRGRVFGPVDRADAPQVAVINRTMSAHFWPGSDPIGARISFDGGKNWASIVGIVGDVKQRDLASAPGDQIYVSTRQFPPLASTVFVRSVADPMSVTRVVRETVHGMDPDQPVDHFRTLEDVRTGSIASPRLTAILLALFAALALLITATGIAGVLAFSVSQRAHEFGIRMALGANAADVVRMVVRQGMRLVAAGLAIGLLGSVALTRLLAGLLYGVRPIDPITFAAAALLLATVASLACFLPARRATQADPMVTLRSA